MLASMRNERYCLGIKYDDIVTQSKEMEQFLDSAYLLQKKVGQTCEGHTGNLNDELTVLFLNLAGS